MLVVLARCHSPLAPTSVVGIDRHSCKYMFQVFQTFQRYVAVVSYGCCTCCKCFRDMLQELVQNVSSVPDVCCKHFDLDVAYVSHICCSSMFQKFHLFQSSVTTSVFMLQVASVRSGCYICFHIYVVSVCYRCFICFRRMLHSNVSYCTCFMLFESQGTRGSNGGTTRAPGNRA
jgi:hypothetical protein